MRHPQCGVHTTTCPATTWWVRPQLSQKAAEMVQMRGDHCAGERGGDRGVDLRGSRGQLGQMDTKGN